MTLANPSSSSSSSTAVRQAITVGVLAIQGAFQEHANHINRLNDGFSLPFTVRSCLVRTPEQLANCDALIIPGGESTSISLGADRIGLLEPLRQWVRQGRPVWGTCAGMIMLSREASGGKKGGQQLLGGVDVRVGRNGFGSQVVSFESLLSIPVLGETPFNCIFIRAPVVDMLLPPNQPSPSPTSETERIVLAPPLSDTLQKRPPIEILASLPEPVATPKHSPLETRFESLEGLANRPQHDSQIVAIRQGHILATSFHPELTQDSRIHHYFIDQIVVPLLVEPAVAK